MIWEDVLSILWIQILHYNDIACNITHQRPPESQYEHYMWACAFSCKWYYHKNNGWSEHRQQLTVIKCLVNAAKRGSCTCPLPNGQLLPPNQVPEARHFAYMWEKWQRDRGNKDIERPGWERLLQCCQRQNALPTYRVYSWQQHRWSQRTKSAGITAQCVLSNWKLLVSPHLVGKKR